MLGSLEARKPGSCKTVLAYQLSREGFRFQVSASEVEVEKSGSYEVGKMREEIRRWEGKRVSG